AAGFADTCGADAGLLVGVLPDEGAKVWRSFEMNFLSILRPQLWSFALVGNHGCDARRRRIRRASTTPATKPPACAHHATPASPGSNPNPFTACNPNHNTKNTTAGTGTTGTTHGTNVTTHARGNSTRYAPSTPEIAPLAPTIGVIEPGSTATCAP